MIKKNRNKFSPKKKTKQKKQSKKPRFDLKVI